MISFVVWEVGGCGYLYKVYWDFICNVDVTADSWEGKEVYQHFIV